MCQSVFFAPKNLDQKRRGRRLRVVPVHHAAGGARVLGEQCLQLLAQLARREPGLEPRRRADFTLKAGDVRMPQALF